MDFDLVACHLSSVAGEEVDSGSDLARGSRAGKRGLTEVVASLPGGQSKASTDLELPQI